MTHRPRPPAALRSIADSADDACRLSYDARTPFAIMKAHPHGPPPRRTLVLADHNFSIARMKLPRGHRGEHVRRCLTAIALAIGLRPAFSPAKNSPHDIRRPVRQRGRQGAPGCGFRPHCRPSACTQPPSRAASIEKVRSVERRASESKVASLGTSFKDGLVVASGSTTEVSTAAATTTLAKRSSCQTVDLSPLAYLGQVLRP